MKNQEILIQSILTSAKEILWDGNENRTHGANYIFICNTLGALKNNADDGKYIAQCKILEEVMHLRFCEGLVSIDCILSKYYPSELMDEKRMQQLRHAIIDAWIIKTTKFNKEEFFKTINKFFGIDGSD